MKRDSWYGIVAGVILASAMAVTATAYTPGQPDPIRANVWKARTAATPQIQDNTGTKIWSGQDTGTETDWSGNGTANRDLVIGSGTGTGRIRFQAGNGGSVTLKAEVSSGGLGSDTLYPLSGDTSGILFKDSTGGNTLATLVDNGTSGYWDATGTVRDNTTGDYNSGCKSANCVNALQAGSAGGVRTTYANVDLNGINLANNANQIGSASGQDLNLRAPTGQAVNFAINGVLQAHVSGVKANTTTGQGQINASHLAGASGAPTSPTAGTGCGTSSVPAVTGSDMAGQLTVKCGTAGTAGNPIITATFAHAYNTAPWCVISPANATTIASLVSSDEVPTTTTTTIAITCAGGTCVSGGINTLAWNYVCSQ